MALTKTHIERGLRAEFQRALDQQPDPRLSALMMNINSSTRDEKYGWMEAVPTLEEVIDEVAIDGVYKSTYSLENVTYAKAISVKRDDLDDDQVGGAIQRVRDLTTRARKFPEKLLLDAINNNGNAYDGQAFFSTTHATGDSGTQSNSLTGTGTTLAQIQTDYNNALEAMMAFNDGSGNPIMETDMGMNLLVMCPPALFGQFRDLANAALISNTTNTLQGSFEVVAANRLSDTNDWYLFNIGNTLKPFILQQRAPIEFSSLENDSDIGVLKERYVWKVRWRGAVGYGFWQMGVRTTNT